MSNSEKPLKPEGLELSLPQKPLTLEIVPAQEKLARNPKAL